MGLEQKLSKGFDAHDALIVTGFGATGYLLGGPLGAAIGLGAGYIASQAADHKSYL